MGNFIIREIFKGILIGLLLPVSVSITLKKVLQIHYRLLFLVSNQDAM